MVYLEPWLAWTSYGLVYNETPVGSGDARNLPFSASQLCDPPDPHLTITFPTCMLDTRISQEQRSCMHIRETVSSLD